MAAHAKLSPSSAERWWNCPGSIAFCATLPPPPPSPYAAEGTAAHEVAARILLGKVEARNAYKLVGEVIKTKDDFEVEITDEMVDCAITYADRGRKDIRGLGLAPGTAFVQSRVECRVAVDAGQDSEFKVWGTLDFAFWKPGKLMSIRDYKFGKGVEVEVEENKQLSVYAIAAMDSLGCGWVFNEVELGIDQPRSMSPGGQVKRWKAPVSWFKEFKSRLLERAKATLIPDAPLVAGPWCPSTFCPAFKSGVCKVAAEYASSKVRDRFAVLDPSAVLPVVEAAGGEGARLPDVQTLSVADAASALRWEGLVSDWFTALRLRIETELKGGKDVPWWKLVEGRSNRQWIDEEAAARSLAQFVPEDKLFEKKFVSPAKAEKLAGKEAVANLTHRPPGKLTAVVDEDRRPDAKPNVALAFDRKTKEGEDPFAPISPARRGNEEAGQADVCPGKATQTLAEIEAELIGGPVKRPPIWPQ